ncbi:MAG: transposase [Bacillota bacterium]
METISNNRVQHRLSLIWCPKYRRKVLAGEVAERLRELLLRLR